MYLHVHLNTHASTSDKRSSLLGKISDRSTRVKDLPRDWSLDSRCYEEKEVKIKRTTGWVWNPHIKYNSLGLWNHNYRACNIKYFHPHRYKPESIWIQGHLKHFVLLLISAGGVFYPVIRSLITSICVFFSLLLLTQVYRVVRAN